MGKKGLNRTGFRSPDATADLLSEEPSVLQTSYRPAEQIDCPKNTDEQSEVRSGSSDHLDDHEPRATVPSGTTGAPFDPAAAASATGATIGRFRPRSAASS